MSRRKRHRKESTEQPPARPHKSNTNASGPPIRNKQNLIDFLPQKWRTHQGQSPRTYQYNEDDHDNFSTMFAGRPWQPTGFTHIVNKVLDERSHFITDDCGTGKTVQIVTALHVLVTNYAKNPANGCVHLILVENDMIATHWCDEFNRWFPRIDVMYYTGSIDERNILRQTRFGMTNTIDHTCFRANTTSAMPRTIPTIVIATTTLFQKDHALLFEHYPWYTIVVDEGHWVKNNDSNQTQLLMSMTYWCSIVVSGTVLSKDLDDIWGLHAFITNNVPRDPDDDGITRLVWSNREFQAQIRNYMPYVSLHRTINLENLPPCIHLVLKLELSLKQHEYVREEGTESGGGNNALILRRNAFAWHGFEVYDDSPPSIDVLLDSSSKLNFLNYVVEQLNDTPNKIGKQHRVLVFAFFKTSMELIKMVCESQGVPFHVINGDTSKADKQRAIEDFESPNSDVYVLILGLDAASKGINLLNGDIVLLMEPQPTPYKELQAACRSYRANSTKPVKIITVVSGDSDMDAFRTANGRQESTRNAMGGGNGSEMDVDSDESESGGRSEYNIDRLASMNSCSQRNRRLFKSILFDSVTDLNSDSGRQEDQGLLVWHVKNMDMEDGN